LADAEFLNYEQYVHTYGHSQLQNAGENNITPRYRIIELNTCDFEATKLEHGIMQSYAS
jgi:hypothetical protein